jgi:hypothetical protein
MQTPPENLRIDLVDTLNELTEQLQRFTNQLLNTDNLSLPSYVVDTDGHVMDREEASRFFKQIEYSNEQSANTTARLYGYLGVLPEVIVQAESINSLKQHLASLFAAAKQYRVTPRHASDKESIELVTATLAAMGRARLQKQQATRLIQCVPLQTQTLSFFWANVQRVKKISIEETRQRLSRHADDLFYQAELSQLDELADTENLAEVSKLPKQVRVNIGYLESGQSRRFQRSCSIPILLPMVRGDQAPLVNPLVFDYDPRPALPRSDKKLAPTPLFTLNQFKYYRYLESMSV